MWLCEKVISSYSSVASKQSIPIGNLTSQIFSNVYLNEFDRFVRHQLKPQAYIRYGDDFVVFTSNKSEAEIISQQSRGFLLNRLSLLINPKNDVIVQAKSGLKFLGHIIHAESVVVDRHTTQSVLAKVTSSNIASYRSLALAEDAKAKLDWILLEQIFDNTI